MPRAGGRFILENVTLDGRRERFENLVFHGGEGETLTMRRFSKEGVLGELRRAGFTRARLYAEPCWEFGVYWPYIWSHSQPISARWSSQPADAPSPAAGSVDTR